MYGYSSVGVSPYSNGGLLLCSMSVVEESFEYLDAPVERITGADVLQTWKEWLYLR